jgi:hypothetical protein
MHRRIALPLAVAVAVVAGIAAPSLAGEVADEDSMALDPTEGPPGTEITVTGEGCATKGDVEVDVRLYDTGGAEQDDTVVTPSNDGFDGAWEATLTVPADTTDYGDWMVDARCLLVFSGPALATAGAQAILDYTDQVFTVVQPVEPEPEPEPAPEPAPAPAPQEAAPSFTG